jgi:hypothetical protein
LDGQVFKNCQCGGANGRLGDGPDRNNLPILEVAQRAAGRVEEPVVLAY